MATVAMTIQRTDDRSLLLQSIGGPLLSSPSERFFQRRDGRPAIADASLQASDPKIKIGSRDTQGRVTSFRATFARSLDDPRYLFLWERERVEVFDMPRVGETRALPQRR